MKVREIVEVEKRTIRKIAVALEKSLNERVGEFYNCRRNVDGSISVHQKEDMGR